MFRGYIAVLPICPVCDNDNEQYPSDDFAPYVTIFLVLHLLVPILLIVDHTWNIAVSMEMLVALPLFLLVTLLVLPLVKGGVIGTRRYARSGPGIEWRGCGRIAVTEADPSAVRAPHGMVPHPATTFLRWHSV